MHIVSHAFLCSGSNITVGSRSSFNLSDDATSIAEREKEKDVANSGVDLDASEPLDHNNVVVISAAASAVGGVLVTLVLVLLRVVVLRRRRRSKEAAGDNDQIRKSEDNEVYGIYFSSEGRRIDQSIMEVRDTNDYYGSDD